MASCIQSDPIILGLGVRLATYAQSVLSFIPAIQAIRAITIADHTSSTVVEHSELKASCPTLHVTPFAILFSAIIHAATSTTGLTDLHAFIILSLSWINNTSTFIWFLLYVQRGDWSELQAIRKLFVLKTTTDDEKQQRHGGWKARGKGLLQILKYPLLTFGTLHFSVMAILGIWSWVRLSGNFDQIPQPCAMPPSIYLLGNKIPSASSTLRYISIIIYSILITPIFNLAFPLGCVISIHTLFNNIRKRILSIQNGSILPRRIRHHVLLNVVSVSDSGEQRSVFPSVVGLTLLAATNMLLVLDIETMLRANRQFQGPEMSKSTFGQTLPVLLLLVPIHNLIETWLQRRERERKRGLSDLVRSEVVKEERGTTERSVKKGAEANAQSKGTILAA